MDYRALGANFTRDVSLNIGLQGAKSLLRVAGERPVNERLKEFPGNTGSSNYVVFERDARGLVRLRKEVPTASEASDKPWSSDHFDRGDARALEAHIFHSHAKSVPGVNGHVNPNLRVRGPIVKVVALGKWIPLGAASVVLRQIEQDLRTRRK
jgi:hypothetical protein